MGDERKMNKEELTEKAEEYTKNLLKKLGIKEDMLLENQPKYLRQESMNFVALDVENVTDAYLASAEPREKRIAELEAQIEKMKCCENCGWYYLQQHWRESKEINESRMFHCGTCGNKRNWKLKEIKEK